MSDLMIEARDLTKQYGPATALKDVSFEVRKGEVLGFLGPNGAGKTTTMKILTCFIAPTSGTAKVNGADIFEDPMAVRSAIGYLPESTPLYTEMLVLEYLEFVAKMRGFKGEDARKRIKKAVEQTTLGDVIAKEIRALSKGYRQRVGLAQALVHEPPVLILDEPTSGLDPRQRTEVRDLIKGLRGYHTVLISTHILPEVSDVADRVVIMNRGRAMAVDTPQNLGGRLRAREVARLEFIVPDQAGDAAQRLCSAVPGVERVEIDTQAGSGLVIAHLESSAGVDVRSAAAEAIVRQGWRLLSLSGETL